MTDAATLAALTPKGKFMCVVCFDLFPVKFAYVDEDGQAWDMCQKDGEQYG